MPHRHYSPTHAQSSAGGLCRPRPITPTSVRPSAAFNNPICYRSGARIVGWRDSSLSVVGDLEETRKQSIEKSVNGDREDR
ncbi:hypothetical protein JTE90_021624 [Oedothorax gibbosus]|uniref:Uncharacterized protein n=1 Tax=Oedothorax gibbosus TaxID=931172 RepID=A0AAV6VP91_9ARAC|nr:hypothetical protein JTE90_021624 [Oedothorax gibbosus]